MKKQQPNQILSSIQESYFHQFEQKLDDRLLNYVVEKEIQKKREAFLQVQLATSCLSLEGLNSLRKYLQKNIKAKGEAAEPTTTPQAKSVESSLSKITSRAVNAPLAELDFAQEGDDEDSERLKRRAYARAYYHRKKVESDQLDAAAAKKFKTTPEQRAYQRAYYKRKKTIDKQRTRQDEVLANNKHRLFAEDTSHLNEQARSTKNELVLKESGHSKGPAVNYEALSADRLAIDHAFRSSSLNPLDFDQALKQENSGSNSLSFNTKTKLRKAKESMRSSS